LPQPYLKVFGSFDVNALDLGRYKKWHWFRRMWKQKPSIARVTTLVERTLYGSNLT